MRAARGNIAKAGKPGADCAAGAIRRWRLPVAALIVLGVAGCIGPRAMAPNATPAPDTMAFVAAAGTTEAKILFGAAKTGSTQRPAPLGSYAKGCLAGAEALPDSGPTWQVMRPSRNRNWAAPQTVDFLQRLSAFAAKQPAWQGLYVGDLSQPRGGPMLSGHASHQIGLDADIWLRPADDLTLTPAQRETLAPLSLRRANGAFVNPSWSKAHHAILRAAAQDPRVARIFIFPGAKVQMCKDETGDRTWLGKVRPWYGHHYHFHVRLRCPGGATGCQDQRPPPDGDGCAQAQRWVDDILNPPPPKPQTRPPRPKPPLALKDLPTACSSVLRSP